MSAEFVTTVDVTGVALVDALDAFAKVGARRGHEEVDVVRHETEGENCPAPFLHFACDKLQIALPVRVVVEKDST
jgi:hypothetical protein